MIQLVTDEVISQTDFILVRRNSHSVDATLIHAWSQYFRPEFYDGKGTLIAPPDCADHKSWGDISLPELYFLRTAIYQKCHSLPTFLTYIGSEGYLGAEDNFTQTALHSCIRGLYKRDCSGCMSMVRRLLQYDDGKLANIPDN